MEAHQKKQIWVDADACPRVIKEMIFKASNRVGIQVTLVANQPLQVPRSPRIRTVQVSKGFDVADNYIVDHANSGDMVVTADIPLAADAVEKGCLALNPRGALYTPDNIRQRLSRRNRMEELRSAGVHIKGPDEFSLADRQAFAKQLDRFLVKF